MDVSPDPRSVLERSDPAPSAAARARQALAERSGGLRALQSDDWRALVVGSVLIALVLVGARLAGTAPGDSRSTARLDEPSNARPDVGSVPGPGNGRLAGSGSGPAPAGADETLAGGGSPKGQGPDNRPHLGQASRLPARNDGPGPGAGVLMGRLIDAVTGLPVADAGVQLVGLEARTISAPDGRFRFEGLPAGTVTVVIGPADGYLARSRAGAIASDGLDLGIMPLLPMSFSALVTPDFGGRVAPCDGSTVDFATQAFVESTAVWATCLADPTDFPAPAPPGRLPLAVLDLSPADIRPEQPLRVRLALPSQPRYASGVKLDVLRLDLEQLVWLPVGTFTVDAGGSAASGQLNDMGTFLVAAPPYGALDSSGTGAQIVSFAVHGGGDRAPVDAVQAGKLILYAAFDYAGLNNTLVMVRTVNAAGDVVFESRRPYTDGGHDDVPMTAGDAAWPAGEYTTTIYQGDPPHAFASQTWRVALGVPTPRTEPTIPAVALSSPASLESILVPTPPSARAMACLPPSKWWARIVQAGDTLIDLARRSGSTITALVEANCLSSDLIYVGQRIYLPRPPLAAKPAGIPGPPAWQPPGYKPIISQPRPGYGYPTLPTGRPTPYLPGQPGASDPGGYASPAPKYSTPQSGGGQPQPTLAPAPWGDFGQATPSSGANPGPGGGPGGGQGGGAGSRGAGSQPGLGQPTPPPPSTSIPPRSEIGGSGAPTLAPPKQTRPPDPTLAPRP